MKTVITFLCMLGAGCTTTARMAPPSVQAMGFAERCMKRALAYPPDLTFGPMPIAIYLEERKVWIIRGKAAYTSIAFADGSLKKKIDWEVRCRFTEYGWEEMDTAIIGDIED